MLKIFSKFLVSLLKWFSPFFLGQFLKLLASIGIGVMSNNFVSALIERYLSLAMAEVDKISMIAWMIHLSSLDKALSIIIGALSIRASIVALSVTFTNPKDLVQ